LDEIGDFGQSKHDILGGVFVQSLLIPLLKSVKVVLGMAVTNIISERLCCGCDLQLTRSKRIFRLRNCSLRPTSHTRSCLLLWRKLARKLNMSE